MVIKKQLILGSSSVNRLEMLKRITDIDPIIINPDINEDQVKRETPMCLAKRLSLQKACSVLMQVYQSIEIDLMLKLQKLNTTKSQTLIQNLNSLSQFKSDKKNRILSKNIQNSVILSCDTVCSRGRIILPKATTNEDVEHCMKILSGRNHDVFTGVCTIDVKNLIFSSKVFHTKIKFKNLSNLDIKDMVSSGDGINKAGGYTINGFAESFIIQIVGSYSNVVGLPLYGVRNMLKFHNVL